MVALAFPDHQYPTPALIDGSVAVIVTPGFTVRLVVLPAWEHGALVGVTEPAETVRATVGDPD